MLDVGNPGGGCCGGDVDLRACAVGYRSKEKGLDGDSFSELFCYVQIQIGVTTEPGAGNTANETTDGGTTFGKLKQTISSSLLTAQDKVTKMAPRPSLIPDVHEITPPNEDKPSIEAQPAPPTPALANKTEPGKPPSRAGACRVCLKAFKQDDFSRTCAECTQRVCEDCASYSKLKENEDPDDWTCSVCRRKLQSKAAIIAQDSNESLLEIPLQELQRRHSEARLGSGSGGGGMGGLSVGGLGSGLAPPRSPELRRHSDVSPASLKELEKIGEDGLYFVTKNQISTTRTQKLELKGTGAKTPDPDWTRNRSGRSAACSRQNSPPREIPAVGPVAPRSRRASRVARQHSYDDEVKNSIAPGVTADNGLALPAPMPRRASAYDVFSVPGLSTVTTAPTAGMTRRASFRIAPPQDPGSPPSPDGPPACLIAPEEDRRTARRGSRLPDIAGLRPMAPRPTPALEDLEAAPRRQQSVDAEAIRIVIHDVDSGTSAAAQKRVVLRRDPSDKAHRNSPKPVKDISTSSLNYFNLAVVLRPWMHSYNNSPFYYYYLI
ncbi:unnamed protein product [Diabrotica balteata]|uniref:FYVE-type domain-containing protein n=1 Tax=Diabrotica balteata TaxID=107213 RepID=A0A9N9XCE5_DIABA|nr:unnamed protein product [Diabrotica balteata]